MGKDTLQVYLWMCPFVYQGICRNLLITRRLSDLKKLKKLIDLMTIPGSLCYYSSGKFSHNCGKKILTDIKGDHNGWNIWCSSKRELYV